MWFAFHDKSIIQPRPSDQHLNIMNYPALFEAVEEGGFVLSFRDIPEAITQGETEEHAKAQAEDALLTAMEFYFEDKRPVPHPSALRPGEQLVSLPLSVWIKVLLLNEQLAAGVKNAELARRMGAAPQEVNRITNLHHTTKIDTIAKAFACLGKQLLIDVEQSN